MEKNITRKEKNYNKAVVVLSILIPLAVAILFGVKIPNVEPLSFLPPIYAGINAATALLLITALWAIKNGKRPDLSPLSVAPLVELEHLWGPKLRWR